MSELWDVPPAPLCTVAFTEGAAEDINVKSSLCHNLFRPGPELTFQFNVLYALCDICLCPLNQGHLYTELRSLLCKDQKCIGYHLFPWQAVTYVCLLLELCGVCLYFNISIVQRLLYSTGRWNCGSSNVFISVFLLACSVMV